MILLHLNREEIELLPVLTLIFLPKRLRRIKLDLPKHKDGGKAVLIEPEGQIPPLRDFKNRQEHREAKRIHVFLTCDGREAGRRLREREMKIHTWRRRRTNGQTQGTGLG